jgi:hypothetical protein
MNNEELKGYVMAKILQSYVENAIERIAGIIEEAEKDLSKKEFGYFKSELGNYFNEL